MSTPRNRLAWLATRRQAVELSAHRFDARPYLIALGCVALSTALAFTLESYASVEDEAMIYLLGIIVVALRFEMRVSIFASIASILSCDFFFIPPRMAFAWTDARKMLIFLAMVVVAAVVSGLSARLHHEEKAARRAAGATKLLYELNVELSRGGEPKHLAAITGRRLQRALGASVLVLLSTPDGNVESASTDLSSEEILLAEQACATRDLSQRSSARGYATWLPVLGMREPLAVIGLQTNMSFDQASEEGVLLRACARELATAMERTQLSKAAHRSQLEAETEHLRSSLLSAISHDLKTPLAGIVAAGTTLLEQPRELDEAAARNLLGSIVREGERLGYLLQNLLSISRLESPTIDLRRTPESVEEIVATALGRLSHVLSARTLRVAVPAELPLVLVEPALIEQVLLNLLENSLRYSPASAAIELVATAREGHVTIRVADTGPGIAESEREKVFEKFFRGSRAKKTDGGVGLGLTICRAIVRAHEGRITIRERRGGGTLVEFTLPMSLASAEDPEPELSA